MCSVFVQCVCAVCLYYMNVQCIINVECAVWNINIYIYIVWSMKYDTLAWLALALVLLYECLLQPFYDVNIIHSLYYCYLFCYCHHCHHCDHHHCDYYCYHCDYHYANSFLSTQLNSTRNVLITLHYTALQYITLFSLKPNTRTAIPHRPQNSAPKYATSGKGNKKCNLAPYG